MKLNECSCGCGGTSDSCSQKEQQEPRSYMFFGNLKTIKRAVETLLQMDPAKVDAILSNGHDWANDHIATSKDDVQEVMEFFLNAIKQGGTSQEEPSIISFVKTFEAFNEMKTSSYAKLMNRTEDFPWTRSATGDFLKPNPRSIGQKKERVNSLARERFTQEFLEEFPLYDTIFDTNKGVYAFVAFKFNTNYTNYTLFFENAEEPGSFKSRFTVEPDKGDGGYYISDKEIELTRQSENLLNQMMRYTNFSKHL